MTTYTAKTWFAPERNAKIVRAINTLKKVFPTVHFSGHKCSVKGPRFGEWFIVATPETEWDAHDQGMFDGIIIGIDEA